MIEFIEKNNVEFCLYSTLKRCYVCSRTGQAVEFLATFRWRCVYCGFLYWSERHYYNGVCYDCRDVG